jgi:hypothetical protein
MSVAPLSRLFLHFFDLHFFELAARNYGTASLEAEADRALRFALIAADRVLIPAASYFESPSCRKVVDRYSELFPLGSISLVGGSSDAREFAEKKLPSYDVASRQHASYQRVLAGDQSLLPFTARAGSSTADIASAWTDRGDTPGFAQQMFKSLAPSLGPAFDTRWQEIPDKLGSRAFTPEYVMPLLVPGNESIMVENRVAAQINGSYFASFSREFRAGFVSDMVLFASGFALDDRYGNLPYQTTINRLRDVGRLQNVSDTAPDGLLALRDDPAIASALVLSLRTVEPKFAYRQPKLDVTVDLTQTIKKIKTTRSGTDNASRFHELAADLLSDLFIASVGPTKTESVMDQDRIRNERG